MKMLVAQVSLETTEIRSKICTYILTRALSSSIYRLISFGKC